MAKLEAELLPEATRLGDFAHPQETFVFVGHASAEAAANALITSSISIC